MPEVTQPTTSRARPGRRAEERARRGSTPNLHTKQHISEGLEEKYDRAGSSGYELLKNWGEGSLASVNSVPGIQ